MLNLRVEVCRGALPYSPGSERVGHLHWHCLPTPAEGWSARLPQSWIGKGHLLRDEVALCGHPSVHSALAPLRPLCSEGEKATGLLPALGRGRQQSECCCHGYGVLREKLPGLLRSG